MCKKQFAIKRKVAQEKKLKTLRGRERKRQFAIEAKKEKKTAIDRVSGKTRKFWLRESWLNKERSGWMRRVAKISA
jgi:hypothetical protein